MTLRDARLFAAWAALAALLLLPAGFWPAFVPFNFGDLYAYHIPMRHVAVGALQEGRLPFWNPYLMSGLPLLANSQSALFYPLSALSWLFPLPLALSWDMLLHWLWGGLGALLLARRAGLGALGSWTLAAAYGFCPFLLYRITAGIPTLLAALAWVPWCWLAWQSGRTGLLAAAWALQGLSGHPQFLLVNAIAMLLYGLMLRRAAPLWTLAREGLGAAILAVVQWPLTWEFLSRSVRQDWPAAFTAAYSVAPRDWLHLLRPGIWGDPLGGGWTEPPSVFLESAGLFIGLAGLGLALAGLSGRRAWMGAGLVAAGLFLALGAHNPVYAAMTQSPLGLMRTPARYLLIALLGLFFLAGAGWRRLEAAKPRPGLKALVALLVAGELLLWGRRFVGAQDARPFLQPNAQFARRFAGAPFRLLTDPELANPNKTAMYRAMNVNGYEAFYLAGYPELAARSEGEPAADPSRTYLRRATTPEMKALSVAYALRPDGLETVPGAWPLARFLDGKGERIVGPLRLERPRPERWRLRAQVPEGAALLVASQPLYPGWSARIDGHRAPLERWEEWFQALTVPLGAAGRVIDVRIEFEPPRWAWLAFIGAAAWGLWLAALLRAREPA